MRIMIGIGHPKQVHIWRNVIKNLISDGHEIKIIASNKDITRYLLDTYGFHYELLPNYTTFAMKALGLVSGTIEITKIAKKFNPDVLIGGTPYFVYVAKIFNKPHITFSDTEHVAANKLLTYPFTDLICTPSCFKNVINIKKHLTFNGYFELAYLHPNYFKPNPNVLKEMALNINEKFIIIRFVSWSASHDIGHSGIDDEIKMDLILKLKKHAKVFISSEKRLPSKFTKYLLKIAPEKFHDLLYYASLYVGEGGATASEAAILGTPSIYVSSLKGTMGNFEELEEKYHMVYALNDSKDVILKATDLLKTNNIKDIWKVKRDYLISDKIDVSNFLVNLIENYSKIK